MQLLRKIAFPFSLIYALVVHIRNYLYDTGLFTSKSFKTPTICVGNLSVGGTGKTPMIEYLIENLSTSFKIAVLSRGYRRKSKGYVLAGTESKVEDIGDEPYQIHSKFPNISVAVDADRCRGIRKLQETIQPDVILLDDAFQHRKVQPQFSLLLTSYDNLYIKDWYLPTGDLRDSKREAKRANIIIVTKCPVHLNKRIQEEIIKNLNPKQDQQVLFCYYYYSEKLLGNNSSVSLDDFKGKRITLVTGIANPKALVDYLAGKGIDFEHLEYKDHHFFTKQEIDLINSKEHVLTTEKDFVRLNNEVENLHYISVKHVFLDEGSSVLERSLQQVMS
ncbi:tetraacyldisaccharide 4'-kinase [Maribacter sp. HTCC2170]|uniref:tetraacyldisaccharide 4'-kinase n=1 Tax=Maribacter sp. (strain HTCC2170 / KCCM 42371) TaxID=313603 RepID=UPI0002E18387|nr:tetraacyldisaccharide 4'-kinase [Maribacter sp. HTCC2170]